DRALSAQTLHLRNTEKTVNAEGRVIARTFRFENARRSEDAQRQVSVPVQIVSDTLLYDGAASIARFEGHAVYSEPGRTLHADRIVTKGSAAGQGPTEATAEGHVSFEGEGRKGRSDKATYRSAERTITLVGLERPAQVVERATGRSWRGPSLTWPL